MLTKSDAPDTTPDGRRFLTYEDLSRETPPDDIVFNCDVCWNSLGWKAPATCFIQAGFRRGVGTLLLPRCNHCSISHRASGQIVELETGKRILWSRLRSQLIDDVMDF